MKIELKDEHEAHVLMVILKRCDWEASLDFRARLVSQIEQALNRESLERARDIVNG